MAGVALSTDFCFEPHTTHKLWVAADGLSLCGFRGFGLRFPAQEDQGPSFKSVHFCSCSSTSGVLCYHENPCTAYKIGKLSLDQQTFPVYIHPNSPEQFASREVQFTTLAEV